MAWRGLPPLARRAAAAQAPGHRGGASARLQAPQPVRRFGRRGARPLCALAGAAVAVSARSGPGFSAPLARRHAASLGPERPALVLAHGFGGGKQFLGSSWPLEYFRGIGDRLRRIGYDVLVTEVPTFGTVASRAEVLCDQIDKWPERRGRRVSVMAHSMGGLDARYAISKLGGNCFVDTLLTVSTPHHGSPVADLLLTRTRVFHDIWRCHMPGFFKELPDSGRCLSVEGALEFNSEVPDAVGVRYLSVAGDRGSWQRTSPELMPSYLYIASHKGVAGGPNDGMVSVGSATWGRLLTKIDMDHLHQINFPLPHRWVTNAPSYQDVLEQWCVLARHAVKGEGEAPR